MAKTKWLRLVLLSFILVFLTSLMACMRSRTHSDDTGIHNKSITINGLKRFYLLYLPSTYHQSTAAPLVVALHGGGGSAKKVDKLLGLNSLADQYGFIVAYPDALDRHWNDGRGVKKYRSHRENIDDVEFISKMIDAISADFSIDNQRVFVTGVSNGAMMSFRLGCELSAKIAAIAPVIGSMPENIVAECAPTKPMPVMMINGTDDPMVPWEGGYVHWYRKKMGIIISVRQTIDFWAGHNGCLPDPLISIIPDTDPEDGTSVQKYVYRQCIEGAGVVLYEIIGGGHTWPGGKQYLPKFFIGKTNQDFNATNTIWKFFNEHPK